MPRHIGIACCSAEGAALCTICAEAAPMPGAARASAADPAHACAGRLRRLPGQEAVKRLRAGGCDAVVLGCTEIPLIVNDGDSPLPVLDSTRLLARAALREALQ